MTRKDMRPEPKVEAPKKQYPDKPNDKALSIADEKWREYHWRDGGYCRIIEPQWLLVGNTTTRVMDASGRTYVVPSVGHYGCYVIFDGMWLF